MFIHTTVTWVKTNIDKVFYFNIFPIFLISYISQIRAICLPHIQTKMHPQNKSLCSRSFDPLKTVIGLPLTTE